MNEPVLFVMVICLKFIQTLIPLEKVESSSLKMTYNHF